MQQPHIEPRQETVESFKVKGITVRTINSDERNPDTAKLGKHWYRYFSEKWDEKIPEKLNNEVVVYGIYSQYASDVNDYYNLTAGVAVPHSSKQLSSNDTDQKIDLLTVESGNYLLFENHGPLPQSIIECWKNIWTYFEQHPEIIRKYSTDFEAYYKDDKVAVYIGIL
jgi:predicted transcriptional regulator YdeE